MDTILVVIGRWVHIISAAYWLAVGFYLWQMMRAELQIDGKTFTGYSAQIARVSKLGMGMAISSGLTVVAGLILFGVQRYWNRPMGSLGAIIFYAGIIVGFAASVHGGMLFGRANREIAGILKGVGGTPTDDQVNSFRTATSALLEKVPLHFGLVAFAFLAMIAGSAIQ